MLHRYTSRLVVVVLALAFAGRTAEADTPALKESVHINEMRFLSTSFVGAVVTMQVRFTANVDGDANLALHFPNALAPIGRGAGEKVRNERVRIRAGRSYVRTYAMRLEDPGVGMVEFFATLQDPPPGYNRGAREHLNVEGTRLLARVLGRADTLRRAVTTQRGARSIQQAQAGQAAKTAASQHYTVNVTGTVRYFDDDLTPQALYGVYGSKVTLWFRNSANPNHMHHPVIGNVQRTHFDWADAQGNFQMAFSFYGDLSGYDQMVLLVGASNPAASLQVQQGAYVNGDASGAGTEFFFGASEGFVYPINGSSPSLTLSGSDVRVNNEDGSILRNMMFARETLERRYNNDLPFSLPIIRVYKQDLDSTKAGIFCSRSCSGGYLPLIKIDFQHTDISTIQHEYGHYVHYALWDQHDGRFHATDETTTEGWAVFFSFVAKNDLLPVI